MSDDHTENLGAGLRTDVVGEFDTSATIAEDAVENMATMGRGLGVLVVKRGPNAGAQFRLDRAVLSAGRHPASDIFLDDITVSRRHAEFHRGDSEFRVIDLGSLNNTYVNREPVDSAVLANGDEVQIGNFRLVFLTGPV
ncbi:FHA domain-containing protein [Mycobacterium sp. 050134]|uniref:FHA domain-containing protein n=1 Tax=Mycobacterium sp. 050134 TaxID=3096111 RepID=UPI002ED97DF8